MKSLIFLSALISTLMMAGDTLLMAENTQASGSIDELIEDYQWQNRVVLIFSPNIDDGELEEQMEHLAGMGAGLRARDLVVWKVINDGSASVNGKVEPDLASQLFYDYFDVQATEFTVILLGKDGTEKLRRNQPVTSQRLFAIIDAMPMRQREMQSTR